MLFQNIRMILLLNTMESRIVYHIERFVAFLFGVKNVNDPEQRIYNKLLRLEGEELENWMNKKVKKYISRRNFVYYELEREELEEINYQIRFKTWYKSQIDCGSGEVMDICEIYGNCSEEYHELSEKLQNYQIGTLRYVRILKCEFDFIINYIEMFIMTMCAEDLKEFIIRQVEPVEIR